MKLHQETGRFGASRLGTGELTDLKRLGQCFFLNSREKEVASAERLRDFQPSPTVLIITHMFLYNIIDNTIQHARGGCSLSRDSPAPAASSVKYKSSSLLPRLLLYILLYIIYYLT